VGQFVSQFFFDDTVTDIAFTSAPYNTRGTRSTRNANDMVYTGATHPDRSLLTLTKTSAGYAASINTIVTIAGDTTPTCKGRAMRLSRLLWWRMYTALYLTNINCHATTASIAMYEEDGSALSMPGGGGSTLNIAANSTSIVELPNSGSSPTLGSISPCCRVAGYSVFDNPSPIKRTRRL